MVKYEFDGRSLEPYPEDALRGNVQLYLASEVDARIAELEKALRIAHSYVDQNRGGWIMVDGQVTTADDIVGPPARYASVL